MTHENEIPMNLDDDEMERAREILGWASPDFPPEGMTGAEVEYWIEQELMEADDEPGYVGMERIIYDDGQPGDKDERFPFDDANDWEY